jgi:hypothetical protein
MQSKWNSGSSCLSLLSAGITVVYHHTWLYTSNLLNIVVMPQIQMRRIIKTLTVGPQLKYF